MASLTRTRRHRKIRTWVEERGGVPAVVKGTGLLRIDFPAELPPGDDETFLEEISWAEWFATFDSKRLSFVHGSGRTSKFLRIISATRFRHSHDLSARRGAGG